MHSNLDSNNPRRLPLTSHFGRANSSVCAACPSPTLQLLRQLLRIRGLAHKLSSTGTHTETRACVHTNLERREAGLDCGFLLGAMSEVGWPPDIVLICMICAERLYLCAHARGLVVCARGLGGCARGLGFCARGLGRPCDPTAAVLRPLIRTEANENPKKISFYLNKPTKQPLQENKKILNQT